jgi:hypothetical protein
VVNENEEEKMFKNYLKVALRNVRKQKAYAFINIAGFAVGMAACILIMLYVLSELSYDKFHQNADRIYRIGVEGNLSGNYLKAPLSNLGTGPTMLKDYPEVESFTRAQPVDRIPVKYEDKIFYEEGGIYVDEHFFKVFSFPLLRGDPHTALTTAYSIVITSEMAKKYFGNEDPLGKQLQMNNRYDYTVTGVLENVPYNSHLKFDFLCSIETFSTLIIIPIFCCTRALNCPSLWRSFRHFWINTSQQCENCWVRILISSCSRSPIFTSVPTWHMRCPATATLLTFISFPPLPSLSC